MQHDETPSEMKYHGLPSPIESQDDVEAVNNVVLEAQGNHWIISRDTQ